MRITPLEIRSHALRRSFKGYDPKEVEEMRELAAEALEEAAREMMELKEKLAQAGERIRDYAANETLLKETIITAQKMVDDLRANARKEAELVVTESRLQAEEIIRQAQSRSSALQEDIFRLRKQRKELEVSIRAVIDYHSTTLLLEEEGAKKADEESEKLKFISR